jgi:catechol 2,3-dioxygenase-like lactoylglutathione lyase family enzyme
MIRLNHISIVSTNFNRVKLFLETILEYEQHHDVESWFVGTESSPTIHVIEIEDAEIPSDDDMFHYYRHFALEVSSLKKILNKALSSGYKAFQMDMEGNEREVNATDDKLDFGIKTLFIRDEDNNLWEFLEKNHSYYGFWVK